LTLVAEMAAAPRARYTLFSTADDLAICPTRDCGTLLQKGHQLLEVISLLRGAGVLVLTKLVTLGMIIEITIRVAVDGKHRGCSGQFPRGNW
jgi:hypothetical protein